MDNPTLTPLEPLVGVWRSAGQTVDGVTVAGTDTYEWLGDGFLVHHVDVVMGGQPVRVIELIGEYDAAIASYAVRTFDGEGTASTMRASVDDDGVWTFADATTRATLTIAADGRAMAARWERADDPSGWRHWMDMSFSRLR